MNEKLTIWGVTMSIWQWSIAFILWPISFTWITFKYLYPSNKKLVIYPMVGFSIFALICGISYNQQENLAYNPVIGDGTNGRNGGGDNEYLFLFDNPEKGSYGATINERNYYVKHPEADTGWKKEFDPVPEELKLENALYGWLDMNYEH